MFEPCPSCGSTGAQNLIQATDIFFGSLEDFTYLQCAACGHVRLQMDDHVGSGKFGRGTFGDKDQQVVVGVMDHPALGWGFYNPRTRWLGDQVGLTPAHSVLDVGAGSGHLLARLQSRYGCACTGLDLDPIYAARASKNGVRHVTGDFEQFETDERFDLITMFHLLEHLNSPRAAIAAAYRLLKPGGHLYVETPAADSLAFAVFGKFWLPLLPPYHRHVFSRRSLENLMQAHFKGHRRNAPSGVYVPGEIIVSTWLWFARYSPHPFRRTRVAPPVKLAALVGMSLTSLLALPVELTVGATTTLLDAISRKTILLAAHQRMLVRKPA